MPVTMGLGAHAGWVWRQVLPAVTTRLRRRIAGRATEEYLPKRPELLPVSADL
jgi:hypothetical protein